ncbi:MAG TPA: hypothetical protein VGG94_07015 [Chthoniobacterales bacterium]|jgi:hypothetical protein
MAASASLRRLLARAIDYAGLFPPCSLDLSPALANQASYVGCADSWMLSAFVLPAARFGEVESHLAAFDPAHPLQLSALGAKKESTGDFMIELKETHRILQAFAARNAGRASLHQLEMALPKDADAATLNEARAILVGADWQCFWEAPADAAEQTIGLLSDHNDNVSAGQRGFGFKLRTGGVTADAFPTSAQIARALIAAAQNQVPIKFTAGLHHPVRQHREEVQTRMHGFLNVLGAGVLAARHRWNEEQTAEMLESEDASLFGFDQSSFRWREWQVQHDEIERHRQLITSFGSCSFDEPREDLRALGFL